MKKFDTTIIVFKALIALLELIRVFLT
ncbi:MULTISPECIES: damage-inducible type I toxin DinQ [Xenorhabdus]